MKLLFFSDVHGVPSSLERLFEHADALKPDQMVMLGDALYHGPRNGVPGWYDPQRTADLLNDRRTQILAVRGNCDADVDQFLLKFPILADFSEILTETRRFFLTHGHLWNAANVPPVPRGTVLAHGHTHIPELRVLPEGVTLFNPGSVSLPKRNNPPTFGFFDGEKLTVRRLEDGAVFLAEPAPEA